MHPYSTFKIIMSLTILKGASSVLQMKTMLLWSCSLKHCILTLSNASNYILSSLPMLTESHTLYIILSATTSNLTLAEISPFQTGQLG